MSRRANAASRCEHCRMHAALCLCSLVPELKTSTRLVLLVHKDEVNKPTNTGLLAARCLPNSVVVVVGGPYDVVPLANGAGALMLFPAPQARALSVTDAPATLFVPDGTWRQARKIRSRHAALAALPCVTLPPGPPTQYLLRTEGRAGGLSTLEAIARAFGILEGAEVQERLLMMQRVMVERTLWLRGALRDHELTDGLPEAARWHDPRGGLPRR